MQPVDPLDLVDSALLLALFFLILYLVDPTCQFVGL